MCGICGKICLDHSTINPKDLVMMTDRLIQRGPDGEGYYFSKDGKVGLGHRRLAIIDLESGSQPMTNEDKTLWMVFNGEIYNFLEIRKDLERKGHRFRTKSDTEVILHCYEEYGSSCVKFFNGMFAIALWDEREKKLFLARDRLGKKPLFYTKTKNAFWFASEVKALLCNPEIKKEIDTESLGMYLSLGYFLSPFSIVKNVKKLPPASTLTLRDKKTEIKQYWDLDLYQKYDLSEDNLIEQFLVLLKESVKIRLISDVPLGSFLSGGIDSTAVVSFMREVSCFRPKTFSIGFKEPSYSELDYSQLASRFLGTDHQALTVEPDILSALPKIIWANDEPLSDNSAIPMYFLSKMARKKVKVALSGDGGDEGLAGYETYIADKFFSLYRKLPFKNLFSVLIDSFFPVSFKKVGFDYKIKQFVRAKNFTPEKAHYSWREIFSEEEKKQLLDPVIYSSLKSYDTFEYFKEYFTKYPKAEFLDKSLYVDIKTWLAEDILTKVDRASMGNSLEVRSPFLDYRLVEFFAKVPTDLKLKGFQTKYLLKKAMAGKIPSQIIWRKKEGFNAPTPIWLRGELRGLVSEKLSKNNLKRISIFNHIFVTKLVEEYFKGKKDNSFKIWTILNFLMWEENVLNR